MKTIDLRSDTVTTPSPLMRKAIADAVVGDDVFEGDPTVRALEKKTAEILGHEAALFVASGTMGNQVSLRLLASPGDEILCERGSHIVNYEVAAASALSGIQLTPIDTSNGILTPELLKPLIRPENIHNPNTAVIALENTHNRAGGKVYPMELLSKIGELADQYELKYYLDGARIWNAAAYHGIPPSEIAGHFDVVSVCYSKGLGAPVGSAVVSSRDNIRKARRIRKMFGGGMRQVGIIAAGALFALENNQDRIIEDHRRARELARLLNESGLFEINPDEVQTNIVVINLPSHINLGNFIDKLKSRGLLVVPFGVSRIRAVAHLNVDDDDISHSAEILIDSARMEF
jgi:threonine aldolase